MKMTFKEFREHREDYNGYCENCHTIGRWGGTEPDAENYPCENCGENACIGMDYALMGSIEIVD